MLQNEENVVTTGRHIFDLQKQYGFAKLESDVSFRTSTELLHFMRDLCWNEGKHTVIGKKCTTLREFVCHFGGNKRRKRKKGKNENTDIESRCGSSNANVDVLEPSSRDIDAECASNMRFDSSENKGYVHACPWKAVFKVRTLRGISRDPSKTIRVWTFIASESSLQHVSCRGGAYPDARQIKQFPGFEAVLQARTKNARSTAVQFLRDTQSVDLSARPAILYEASDAIKKPNTDDARKMMHMVPPLLLEFKTINPGSVVALQMDDRNRFFRSFVSSAIVVKALDGCLPIMCLDCGHCEGDYYNGVILVLVAVDGERQNLPLAMSYVHKETEENYAWFFHLCMKAGIELHRFALFVNQGPAVEAAHALAIEGRARGEQSLMLNLKYCTLHILGNICNRFNLNETSQHVRRDLFRLQASESPDEYIKNIQVYSGLDYEHCGVDEVGQTIAQYLSNINPRNWIVFANMPSVSGVVEKDKMNPLHVVDNDLWNSEQTVDEMFHHDVYVGRPMALFNMRSTNCVEGEMNKALSNQERSVHVLVGLRSYIESIVTEGVRRYKVVQRNEELDNKLPVTMYADKMENVENEKLGMSTFRVVQTSKHMCSVQDKKRTHSEDPRAHRVNVTLGTCSCTYFMQNRLLCKHILLCRRKIQDSRVIQEPCIFHHKAYLAQTYKSNFEEMFMELPLETCFPKYEGLHMAPYYRQPGGRNNYRHASVDESVKPGAKVFKPQRKSDSRLTKNVDIQYVSQPVPDDTRIGRCGKCGEEGHYKKTCTSVHMCEIEDLTTPIEPGDYLIGGMYFNRRSVYTEERRVQNRFPVKCKGPFFKETGAESDIDPSWYESVANDSCNIVPAIQDEVDSEHRSEQSTKDTLNEESDSLRPDSISYNENLNEHVYDDGDPYESDRKSVEDCSTQLKTISSGTNEPPFSPCNSTYFTGVGAEQPTSSCSLSDTQDMVQDSAHETMQESTKELPQAKRTAEHDPTKKQFVGNTSTTTTDVVCKWYAQLNSNLKAPQYTKYDTAKGMRKASACKVKIENPADQFVGTCTKEVHVFGDDLRSLSPDKWVHSVIIDAWAALMNTKCPHNYYVGAEFYASIENTTNNKHVSRLKTKTTKSKMLEKDKIFIPCNYNNLHWFLVVISPSLHSIDVYDSLLRTSTSYTHAEERIAPIAEWLDMCIADTGSWKHCVKFNNCAKQKDSSSCGIFTCWFIFALSSLGPNASEVTLQEHHVSSVHELDDCCPECDIWYTQDRNSSSEPSIRCELCTKWVHKYCIKWEEPFVMPNKVFRRRYEIENRSFTCTKCAKAKYELRQIE